MHNRDRHIRPNNRVWHDYGLTIILFVLMAGSLIAQYYTGWMAFSAEQLEHKQIPEVWGDGGYIWNFCRRLLKTGRASFYNSGRSCF